ncbi:hypothetical protein LSH36_639g01025 [Paralvinella palmiformis]|uniref:Uncharacterized protein n=1 Tax=Paralvinella palmiformis TaxID=53620 RepID=A0AAD9MU84_9ANNE|nr:hypothetical protein LSH36_639g01025 [Paralvinella palmiformis]
MPVPQQTSTTSRAISRRPSQRSTTINITDIYNRVELTKHRSYTPPWRSYDHVTNIRHPPERKRENSRLLIPETQSLPDYTDTTESPDLSRSRPNTAFDVLSQLRFSPLPDPEIDIFRDTDDSCRPLTGQRSEVNELFAHNNDGLGSHPEASGHQVERELTELSGSARYAASRGFCIRSRSALLRDLEGQVNSLSRQCCDVLGPKICHQCAIIRRRSRDTRIYQSFLPNVDVDEDILTTSLIVSKNYPNLNMEEIQLKLINGDILKPAFKYNLERIVERKQQQQQQQQHDDDDDNTRRRTSQKILMSRNVNGATYNFFTSIKDLNDKIVKGHVIRKIILSGDPSKDLLTGRPPSGRQSSQSFSESVSPKFVSPRKVKFDKRPNSPLYYDPPLVPKVCQNNEFLYPGSQQGYSIDIPS